MREEKRLFGRPRRGWEDNIKMDLKETADLVQGRNQCRDRSNSRGYNNRQSQFFLCIGWLNATCFGLTGSHNNGNKIQKKLLCTFHNTTSC
jgi:hypothetical protein